MTCSLNTMLLANAKHSCRWLLNDVYSGCWWYVCRSAKFTQIVYVSTASCPLIVVDAPRNLRITHGQSIYRPGDRIQCSAEGNPAPSYQWTDLNGGTVIQGSVLVISEDMPDRDHTYRCTASNSVNSNSISFNFTVEGINVLLSELGSIYNTSI